MHLPPSSTAQQRKWWATANVSPSYSALYGPRNAFFTQFGRFAGLIKPHQLGKTKQKKSQINSGYQNSIGFHSCSSEIIIFIFQLHGRWYGFLPNPRCVLRCINNLTIIIVCSCLSLNKTWRRRRGRFFYWLKINIHP